LLLAVGEKERQQEKRRRRRRTSMEGVGRFPEDEEPVVRFFEPAQYWPEALPVGSGRLGAMVFGGVESELVQLNGKVCLITTLFVFPEQ
jgi:alpha-L-fucosidase 2